MHRPPEYYGYERYKNSGYDIVNKCRNCGSIALRDDMNTTCPCKYCGGTVRYYGIAIWIEPEYTGFWLFRKKIKDGYWDIKDEK